MPKFLYIDQTVPDKSWFSHGPGWDLGWNAPYSYPLQTCIHSSLSSLFFLYIICFDTKTCLEHASNHMQWYPNMSWTCSQHTGFACYWQVAWDELLSQHCVSVFVECCTQIAGHFAWCYVGPKKQETFCAASIIGRVQVHEDDTLMRQMGLLFQNQHSTKTCSGQESMMGGDCYSGQR